jgi:hypothetical protein
MRSVTSRCRQASFEGTFDHQKASTVGNELLLEFNILVVEKILCLSLQRQLHTVLCAATVWPQGLLEVLFLSRSTVLSIFKEVPHYDMAGNM